LKGSNAFRSTDCRISLLFGRGAGRVPDVILPRRPSGRLQITRLFYILTWGPWSAIAPRIQNKKVREQVYSIYGPLSLLLLLVLWAVLLVVGLRCFIFALGSPSKTRCSCGDGKPGALWD